MDINAAINAYSESFGNRIEPLRALCGDDLTADILAAEISAVQETIIDLVRSRAGDDGLPMSEIEQLGREHLSATHPEISEIGLQGLMRYIIWYSWHEGYLRRGKQDRPNQSAAPDPPG